MTDLHPSTWRKSNRSNGSGGACVEVSLGNPLVGVRDSKAPLDGIVTVPSTDWAVFLGAVRSGEFGAA
ncbi:DUF397 domain-containing protein [Longispora urticae]